mmetsp:Transcript_18656/g.28269  ORF Transcript_18656/g.28269 Transcript_18656/m.28269 type:complete len:112 (+) Transcript_18656:69-404(+)
MAQMERQGQLRNLRSNHVQMMVLVALYVALIAQQPIRGSYPTPQKKWKYSPSQALGKKLVKCWNCWRMQNKGFGDVRRCLNRMKKGAASSRNPKLGSILSFDEVVLCVSVR